METDPPAEKKKFIPVKTPKLTPAAHKKIVEMLKAGNFKGTAAAHARVHVNTLNNWLLRGLDEMDEFGNVTVRAKEPFRRFRMDVDEATAVYEGESVKAIDASGDWKAKAWLLARRFPHWNGKTTIEHTGSGGASLQPAQLFLTIAGTPTTPWIHDDTAGHDTDPGEDEE